MHENAQEYYHNCDFCQRTGKSLQRDEIALVPRLTLQAFSKWVADIVGPISPKRKQIGERYIITAIDYLTKWDEFVIV